MKVLYAAMYNDPTDIMAASGVDFNFYKQINKYADELRVVGPFRVGGLLPERVFKRLYTRYIGKRYMKWNLHAIWRATRSINQAEKEWHPDVVFSMFPSNLAFYHGRAPVVFATDLTFQNWQENGANFGRAPYYFQNWLEKRTVHKAARVIASSFQLQNELLHFHSIESHKVEVIQMPAALPPEKLPQKFNFPLEKALQPPIRLLLVGRDFHRKGVDIAIQVVALLNARGLQANLDICATDGPAAPFVHYVGSFNKKDPLQLSQYIELYRKAHLLIHPARFDPSPVVTAEAAALGTPTITNDVGGIATSVREGFSGIVLPKHSSPEAYATAILKLVSDPDRYYQLCITTRRRYETELNWDVAGRKIIQILEQVVTEYPAYRNR
jgi:glycosyltransferase involved in cell wall biosynthesis